MVNFRYVAVDGIGKQVRGSITADNERAAIYKLRSQRFVPLEIARTTQPKTPFAGIAIWRRRADMVIFMRTASALVRAGMSLARALMTIVAAHGDAPTSLLALRLEAAVVAGDRLSNALAREPDANPLIVGLIRAGEETGDLGSSLAAAFAHLERRARLRSEAATALAYPALLVTMTIAALAVIVSFVVPRFQVAFIGFESKLPPETRFVLSASAALRDAGPVLLVLVAGALGAAALAWRRPSVRHVIDTGLLNGPFGRFVGRSEFARYLRVLGITLGAGLPLPSALALAQSGLLNSELRHRLQKASDLVINGHKPTEALAGVGHCPEIALSLLRVGEETGQFSALSLEAADYLDADIERTVRRTMNLLEPAMILTMALIIGGIVISLIVGILSMNQLAMSYR
jgi:general secretion pathway protein F